MATISTEQVQRLVESSHAIVIDVMEPADYERAHIPGTVNIPVSSSDFVRSVERVADTHTPIAVYCAGPRCGASTRAAGALVRAGFREVFDYEGGMSTWIAAGNDVEIGIREGSRSR